MDTLTDLDLDTLAIHVAGAFRANTAYVLPCFVVSPAGEDADGDIVIDLHFEDSLTGFVVAWMPDVKAWFFTAGPLKGRQTRGAWARVCNDAVVALFRAGEIEKGPR